MNDLNPPQPEEQTPEPDNTRRAFLRTAMLQKEFIAGLTAGAVKG